MTTENKPPQVEALPSKKLCVNLHIFLNALWFAAFIISQLADTNKAL